MKVSGNGIYSQRMCMVLEQKPTFTSNTLKGILAFARIFNGYPAEGY